MPNSPRPCADRTRRIPNAIALQRGLQSGSRETVTSRRYAIGTNPDVPCLPSAEGRGTRCFAEHSARRKTCRLLAPSSTFDNLFEPGLYVWGLPPFDDPESPLACNIGSLDEEETPFAHLVLGPYQSPTPRDPLRLVAKCLDISLVFDDYSRPENVALRFRVNNDKYIPSMDMMQDAARRVRNAASSIPEEFREAANNLVECAAVLKERKAKLNTIRARCSRISAFEKAARLLVRNTFYFAMYARRWAGPNTPYPISTHDTNRMVGRHKAISPALVGKAVHITAQGEVVLRDRRSDTETPADEVADGKANEMMYAYLRAIRTVGDAAEPRVREALVASLLSSIEAVPAVDGSHWPAEKTLWKCFFDGERSIAAASDCIRQESSVLLATCRMLLPYVYKSMPVWSRYEGRLDEVQ